MERGLNILLLHGLLANPAARFSGVVDVELMFPKYDTVNNYLVHGCTMPLPDSVKKFSFDAIIMTATFMGRVVKYGLSSDWIKQFDFLKTTSARKIVFPQDDYWFSEIRDRFYVAWGVDEVYPVCEANTWPDLIPEYLHTKRTVAQGYTTYVTPYMRSLNQFALPWIERPLDVVYRGEKKPLAPNRLGIIKGELGDRFLSQLEDFKSLSLDISTDPEKLIRGESWYQFIGSAKAVLGSNSGSSMRLRNRGIFDAICDYQRSNPGAGIEKLEKNVIPQIDQGKNYTAISPRVLEAAMLGTLQILVPGSYSGFLKPYQHYIPLDENCKNAKEIATILRDKIYCQNIIASCQKTLLSAVELDATRIINTVINNIEKHSLSMQLPIKYSFEELMKQYNQEMKFRKLMGEINLSLKMAIKNILPDTCVKRINRIRDVLRK